MDFPSILLGIALYLGKPEPKPLIVKIATVEQSGNSRELVARERQPQNEREEIFKQACEGTEIDWKLIEAIGRHESAYFKSPANLNNYWGRKSLSGGYASWSTLEEAAENQCRYLQRYYDRGLRTLKQINSIYAEDQLWHVKVQNHLNKLEGE